MSRDPLEYVAQISEWIDVKPLATGDHAAQHRCCPASIVAAEEHPVLATDSYAPEAALRAVMPTPGLCRAHLIQRPPACLWTVAGAA